MKRSVKNGIMITLILLIIGIIIFTISSIKGDNMPTGMGNPPDMQDSSNQGQMKEPPTKNNTQDSTENKSTSENKPPEKPEGEDNNSPGDMNENNNQAMEHNQSTGISSTYYFALAIEGFILSSLVMYLIMSNFNKKTWKETFEAKDKIIIDLLAVTLLTTGVTYASSKVASTSNNNSGFMKENSNSSITYSSTKEITEDTTITSGTFTSTSSDENTILVSGSTATISNVTVNKTGDSNDADNSNFYGNNSGIIAKDGANLTIDNITVTTDADGANGVFSYGGSATTNNSSSDGTTITISNSTIKTTKDNAGGIMTTGGGTMKAYNLTIETSGTSSAAIRSDRGGGTVTVDGGTYTTTGQGSPSIYSTADITVSNAELISKASEGIVIEGKNSVTIENTNLTDNNTKLNGQSTTYKNIFLYQSMSGDAEDGVAQFTSKNSTITTNNGDTLYVTNTKATINLENNTIVNNDSNGNFLRIQKDSWGTTGSNGGEVTLNMTNQTVNGNIVVDSISTLTMNLSSSYYEGAINTENSAKSITLKLDQSSKIKLTNDCYITSLEDEDTSYSNIDFNGYKLYVNGIAIN